MKVKDKASAFVLFSWKLLTSSIISICCCYVPLTICCSWFARLWILSYSTAREYIRNLLTRRILPQKRQVKHLLFYYLLLCLNTPMIKEVQTSPTCWLTYESRNKEYRLEEENYFCFFILPSIFETLHTVWTMKFLLGDIGNLVMLPLFNNVYDFFLSFGPFWIQR